METKTKSTLVVVSKDDQQAIAVDIFNRYPKAKKVSVASDGQAFITDDNENAAKSHAKNNRYGKELDLTPFTRDGISASKDTDVTDSTKNADVTDTSKGTDVTDSTKSADVTDTSKGTDVTDTTKSAEDSAKPSNTTK